MMDKVVSPMLNGPDAPPHQNNKGKIKETKENAVVSDVSSSKSVVSRKESSGLSEGVSLPLSLMKALRRKTSSVGIGSNSSNGGSGNNSDNSGTYSLGNNSFGFNFDSEEAMLNNSPRNSEADAKTGESDSDSNAVMDIKSSGRRGRLRSKVEANTNKKSDTSSLTAAFGTSTSGSSDVSSHEIAAAAAVANLQSIANACAAQKSNEECPSRPPTESTTMNLSGNKRRAEDNDDVGNESGGYNSDDEGASSEKASLGNPASSQVPDTTLSSSPQKPPANKATKGKNKKTKFLDENKREERNAREKERSFRISRQINELRNLLASGGVIVPKGTKSSVLTEAANYIRMLQQHQYRSEIDRHQLIQQMQMIGGGSLGPQAATAVRHVAAQNGVWSLGNFGGVPPRSAMSYYQGTTGAPSTAGDSSEQKQIANTPLVTTIEEHEYRFVFNSCPVGMAIASMGGSFIECNQLFCQLSNYTKQEICSMTIFNLTSRQDLQPAFDLISQMISPPSEGRTQGRPQPCALRGTMKNRDDLGLSVSLIKGDDGIAKCFCVTLIHNPASPFDSSGLNPATADLIQSSVSTISQPKKSSGSGTLNSSPAYTAG